MVHPQKTDKQLAKEAQDQMDRIIGAGETDEVALLICQGADLAAMVQLLEEKGLITREDWLDKLIAHRRAVIDGMLSEKALMNGSGVVKDGNTH